MSSTNDSFALSMICLGGKPKISPSAIIKDLTNSWRDFPRLGPIEKTAKSQVSFDIGKDATAILQLIGAPIPWSDLEGPCATSVLWPQAAEVLEPHKAHMLVTLMFKSPVEPIERASLLTQVTSAVVETTEAAVGIYWTNASLVVQPKLFREFAVRILPQGPPVPIWVDFRIGPNENGKMSGFTTGLSALGLMELETETSQESGEELHSRFEGLIEYLLENGLVIKDGDTIGQDAKERIKVNYAESAFGQEGQVMRLDYQPVKKGWFSRR